MALNGQWSADWYSPLRSCSPTHWLCLLAVQCSHLMLRSADWWLSTCCYLKNGFQLCIWPWRLEFVQCTALLGNVLFLNVGFSIGVNENDGSEELASLAGVVHQIFHLCLHLCCHRNSFVCNKHWRPRIGDELYVADSSVDIPDGIRTGHDHLLLCSQHFLLSWFVIISWNCEVMSKIWWCLFFILIHRIMCLCSSVQSSAQNFIDHGITMEISNNL